MKHYAILIALTALTLFAACQKKESEREKVDSRTSSTLEVRYEMAGKAVQALSLSSGYAKYSIDVILSNEGLNWNIESDRAWCNVVPDQHKGSGSFVLEVEANETFDDRDAATLTFTAGDFRGFRMTVNQRGSTLLISQPFFVSAKAGNTFPVMVTVPEGNDWDVDADVSWVSVSEGTPVTSGGETMIPLTLTVAANADQSRMGTLTFSSGDVIRLWQFGDEFDEDASGNIFFPKDQPATFSLNVPRNQIRSITQPDFATLKTERVDDVLDRLTFTLSENLSDCDSIRPVDFTLVLGNTTSTQVKLPAMKQDYTPAGGLMTYKGLLLFAQAVSEGNPVDKWQTDGWVTMLQDIDMSKVTNWPGIGTFENPFSGKFDGKGYSIVKLSGAANGLFNYCVGSSASSLSYIKNVNIAKNCSFYREIDGSGLEKACFGALVSQAENAQIVNCSNKAAIEVQGSSPAVYPMCLGGVLGKGGADVFLQNCRMGESQIKVTLSGTTAYVGGIAGRTPSAVGCTVDAKASILDKSTLDYVYIGGITTLIGTESIISGNSFAGTITEDGLNSIHYLGGLYAATEEATNLSFDKVSDMSGSNGTIQIQDHKDGTTGVRLYAGGFIGYAAPASQLSFKGYDVQANLAYIAPACKETATDQGFKFAECCFMGGILGGGEISSLLAGLSFEDISSQGMISYKFRQFSSNKCPTILYVCSGGVVGQANGPSTFVNCVNKGAIGHLLDGSYWNVGNRQQSTVSFMGGIAGYADGGNASFTSCRNEAEVINVFWNNLDMDSYLSTFKGVFCGGILGAFAVQKTGISLTMTSCRSTATVESLRGFVGGIVGFCQNATITSCTFTGKQGYNSQWANNFASWQGGIAGGIKKGSVSECSVKTNIHAATPGSSAYSTPGGIVGRVATGDAVSITSCEYYGTLTATPNSATAIVYPGGIVGMGCDNTSVTNCRFGGTVQTTNSSVAVVSTKTISANNLTEYVIGNKVGQAEGSQYWDGN